MTGERKARLEAAGFRIGTPTEFLGLSPEESALVELKLALAAGLRRRRVDQHVSQAALGRRLGSSQSRVARMEAADATVSLDLLIRALLKLGATPADLGEVIASAGGRTLDVALL